MAASASTKRYDVIIVGGGPVGLSMAASLAAFGPGFEVAIVDQREFSVPKDARASALSAGVTRIFDALGIWDDLAAQSSPVEKMKITDSGTGDLSRPLFLQFEGDVAPGLPYAHLVPNTATIAALMEVVKGRADFVAPAKVQSMTANGSMAELVINDGEVLTAPLIIAADGARSALREMADIKTIGHDYGQMGIVTTIAHELEHENTAYEHFRPAGPFASLPLPGKRSSLVWTEQTEEAKRLIALPKQELAAEIEQAMGSSLGKVEIDDAVQAFPLRLQIADSFVAPRLALIGDAAHVIHPIAGQGLNLGLKDVAALAETIIEAARLGQDIGAADVLDRYQRWRRFDTVTMGLACDAINRLFANDLPPVRVIRDLGLGIVDRMGPVKTALIRHAAGLSSGPKLLKGLPL